jgi:hypothetical protein
MTGRCACFARSVLSVSTGSRQLSFDGRDGASGLLQSSNISAVGCSNNMGEHVNASEDPRDNILGRRRMREGPPNMRRECHLVYLSRPAACLTRALRLSKPAPPEPPISSQVELTRMPMQW